MFSVVTYRLLFYSVQDSQLAWAVEYVSAEE